MQAALDAEFGKDSSDEEEGEGPDGDSASGGGNGSEPPPPSDAMFCPACNKLFKSSKA